MVAVVSMQGTIMVESERAIYVRYESTRYSEPVRDTMFWRVVSVERSPLAMGDQGWPKQGDAVRYSSGGSWNGPKYTVRTGDGCTKAERHDVETVPCPPTRGKQSRWHEGRWEKLMAKGWVTA
jgi:hypothetical protein